MRKNLKKENAITLISLIISIIVLIILAGITVLFVIDGGIIDRAVSAREQTQIGSLKEKLELEKEILWPKKGKVPR